MNRLRNDSTILIWSKEYINDAEKRKEKDRKLRVKQIEDTTNDNEYIVEVI